MNELVKKTFHLKKLIFLNNKYIFFPINKKVMNLFDVIQMQNIKKFLMQTILNKENCAIVVLGGIAVIDLGVVATTYQRCYSKNLGSLEKGLIKFENFMDFYNFAIFFVDILGVVYDVIPNQAGNSIELHLLSLDHVTPQFSIDNKTMHENPYLID